MLSGGELSKVFQPQKHCCTAGLKQRPLQFGQIKITAVAVVNTFFEPSEVAMQALSLTCITKSMSAYVALSCMPWLPSSFVSLVGQSVTAIMSDSDN